MNISDYIAFFALIISIIGIYLSYKNHKTTIEWDYYKENMRKTEEVRKDYYTKNINRINLMPHFHLVMDKEISVSKNSFEEFFIIPISLINIGKENGTNIRLEPISEDKKNTYYFETNNQEGEVHYIRNYIDKKYALIGEVINFSISCKKHDQALNVYFKIRFDDIAGRIYEQEFRFLYDFNIMKQITMNHESKLPKCINENDPMIDPKKNKS